jgi:hypothetical protein
LWVRSIDKQIGISDPAEKEHELMQILRCIVAPQQAYTIAATRSVTSHVAEPFKH